MVATKIGPYLLAQNNWRPERDLAPHLIINHVVCTYACMFWGLLSDLCHRFAIFLPIILIVIVFTGNH